MSLEQKITATELVESRKRLGLYQKDLAKKLGYTQSYISDRENGKQKITLALSISVKNLLIIQKLKEG